MNSIMVIIGNNTLREMRKPSLSVISEIIIMMIAFRMITPLVTPQLKAEYDDIIHPHRMFIMRQSPVMDNVTVFMLYYIYAVGGIGGGQALKRLENSIKDEIFAQADIPGFQTKVSDVICPFWI